MKRVLLVPAVLVAVLGMSGTAFAKPTTVETGIWKEDNSCGQNVTGVAAIAKVKLSRSGNAVTVTVYLKGLAGPNQTYNIYLYENNPLYCSAYTPALATVVTNKKGSGKGKGTVTVSPEATEFFVNAQSAAVPFNESPTVSLP